MKLSKPSLITPVLFLIFNRLNNTKKVFEEIKKARPKQLFIASDGYRKDKQGEKEIVEKVRKYVLDNIDWDCKVRTLFRDKNLGCKYAVSGAIDWFFENVEQGIILEDDVLPNQSFFGFCKEMLEKYKDNKKVMSISGYNPLGKFNIEESYLFSKYFHCWGWATWKRAWKKIDLKLENYLKIKKNKKLRNYFYNFIEMKLFEKRVKDVLNKKVNSWAIPFDVSHRLNKMVCIIPSVNLIENIGFRQNSTHTKENKWDTKFLNHKAKEMKFPLKHPLIIKSDKKFNEEFIMRDLKRSILKKLF